jgi:hypothetical protein
LQKVGQGANLLQRSGVSGAAQSAKAELFDQNKDQIRALQHVSVLDNRTSIICAARANLRWTYPALKPIGHAHRFLRPPLHPRCRSQITPILEGEPLPDTTTINAWLKEQSRKTQEQVLGVRRAGLWRRGKISTHDLVTQRGLILPLEELETD